MAKATKPQAPAEAKNSVFSAANDTPTPLFDKLPADLRLQLMSLSEEHFFSRTVEYQHKEEIALTKGRTTMKVEVVRWPDAVLKKFGEASQAILGKEASKVRTELFVEEQGIPMAMEWDVADKTAVHAVARNRLGQAAATGRLRQHAL